MRGLCPEIIVVCAAMSLVAPAAAQTSRLNHLPPARAPCSVLSGYPCHPSFCGVFHRGPCFPQFEAPIGQDLRLTIVSTDDNDLVNKGAGNNNKSGDEANKTNDDAGGKTGNAVDGDKNTAAEGTEASEDHTLDTIRDMFAALRECWVPPPKDEARHGMEYTIRFAFKRDGEIVAPPRMTYASHDAPAEVRNIYRDAIDAALKRCTPLHFSAGMGDAVAGRPIAIRFVDDRTIDDSNNRP
jgi:hypothetical protein